MKQIIPAIIILWLASVACGSAAPTLNTADDYVEEFGGSADVYERILSLTDCIALQSEFDQADTNTELQEPGAPQYQWLIGYMTAANNRMEEIGCHGDAP